MAAVRVDRSGPVTTVILDRPEVRNAVDAPTAALLAEAFADFEADPDAAVAVLTGAGGLELALWCDLRVAEEDAVLGVFCRRWGVPLIDGGTVRLPQIVGLGRALDLIITGRAVGAAEAEQMGLVTKIVRKGDAREEAERLAAQIAAF